MAAVAQPLTAGDVERLGAEIRTPLALVEEYVELLRAGALGPVSAAQASVLGRVAEEATRLGEVVQRAVAGARGTRQHAHE